MDVKKERKIMSLIRSRTFNVVHVNKQYNGCQNFGNIISCSKIELIKGL